MRARDGRLDVATDEGVLLGSGDGTFASVAPVAGCFLANSLLAADLNRDGRVDLVVVGSSEPPENRTSVEVLLSHGDGTWQGPATYGSGDNSLWMNAIATGDLDGDGVKDLVVGVAPTFDKGPYEIAILRGTPQGDFLPAKYIPTPSSIAVVSLAMTDLDGDGKLDLLALGDRLYVGMGRGDGSFEADREFAPGIGGFGNSPGAEEIQRGPGQIDVGDFNGDCIPDVALACGQVSVLLGRGDGTFGSATTYTDWADIVSLSIGDFNGDGRLDLATSEDILLGNGDGSFAVRTSNAARGSSSVGAGDFNGDHELDLAVFDGNGLSVFLGRGDGTFAPQPAYMNWNYNQALSGTSLLVEDINGDGKLDVTVTVAKSDSAPSSLTVYVGSGDGTFLPQSYLAGQGPGTAAIADFNRDGKLDFAVIAGAGEAYLGNTYDLSVLLNQSLCAQ